MSDLDVLQALSRQLLAEQRNIDRLDKYYRGTQPLRFLHPEISAAVGERLHALAINWPRLIVDSVARRVVVEGFRLPSGAADKELWRRWQANGMDEQSQLAEIEALVAKRAFISVWGNDDDPTTPVIAAESPAEMTVAYVPGTRKIRAALKQFVDGDMIRATLMLPDHIVRYVGRKGATAAAIASGLSTAVPVPVDATGINDTSAWTVDEELDNPLGRVPVVPLVNRPRLTDPTGDSELSDVVPLADAVNKLATDMMVAAEYHAIPRRWATGTEPPLDPETGEELSQWAQVVGRVWTVPEADAKLGQFPEADLANFVSAIKLLTTQIAAIAGLPPHYLGIQTDNPASADAIRSAEASLVERAREKQRAWAGCWEEVMRLTEHIVTGEPPNEMDELEVIWRDPETPTVAQQADATTKYYQAEIIDLEQAQEDAGYSPTQIDAMRERRQAAQDATATAGVRAQLALAQQLMDEQGLSRTAAYAAVGLLQAASVMSGEGMMQPPPPPPAS